MIANNLKVGLIVAGVVYTLFALISLAGYVRLSYTPFILFQFTDTFENNSLVGSLIRSRKLVRTFSIFLWFQLFVSLAYLIAFSIALFDKPLQNQLITQCVNQTQTGSKIVASTNKHRSAKDATLTPDQIRAGCASPFTTNKPAFFVAFAVFFLLTLCTFPLPWPPV